MSDLCYQRLSKNQENIVKKCELKGLNFYIPKKCEKIYPRLKKFIGKKLVFVLKVCIEIVYHFISSRELRGKLEDGCRLVDGKSVDLRPRFALEIEQRL